MITRRDLLTAAGGLVALCAACSAAERDSAPIAMDGGTGTMGTTRSDSPAFCESRYVRLAELEIDPAQLDDFKSAISQGIEAAIRLEPGVLVLYAVSEKENPAHVRVFEMYTDANAYKAHLETPHFQKFRTTGKRHQSKN